MDGHDALPSRLGQQPRDLGHRGADQVGDLRLALLLEVVELGHPAQQLVLLVGLRCRGGGLGRDRGIGTRLSGLGEPGVGAQTRLQPHRAGRAAYVDSAAPLGKDIACNICCEFLQPPTVRPGGRHALPVSSLPAVRRTGRSSCPVSCWCRSAASVHGPPPPRPPTPSSSTPPPRPRASIPRWSPRPPASPIINSIFDNLVERDYTGALVPMLAESWTFPDPTPIEFKLRQGVTFQNGEPFNAASVKFSIERLLDPALNSPLRGGWPKSLPGRRDRRRLHRPLPLVAPGRDHLRRAGAERHDAAAAVLLPELRRLPGRQPGWHRPVSRSSSRSATTTPPWPRNPNYWGVDTYKGTPLVATVIFRPVPNAGTRMADLLNGTADMIFDVSPDDLDALRGALRRRLSGGDRQRRQAAVRPVHAQEGHRSAGRSARAAGAELRGRRRRDRHNLFNGLGTAPVESDHGRRAGLRPESVAPYDYNPTYAKQLLAAAGYPNGFSATMDLACSDNPNEALAVIGQLQQVGVNVQPRTLELGDVQHQLECRTSPATCASRAGAACRTRPSS